MANDRTYKKDRKKYDTYLPNVKKILIETSKRPIKVETANKDLDNSQATDLLIYDEDKVYKMGCRLREDKSSTDHYRDFTIRSKRLCGAKTEIDKLKCTDFYFYGWILNGKIINYMIINTKKLPDLTTYEDKPNKDKESWFKIIPITHITDAIIYKNF